MTTIGWPQIFDVLPSETGLPATPVAAFLSQTYLFGSEQGVPSEEQLPIPADTVTGFANVSNAPLNDADCSFAPTVAEEPSGVVTCNGMVSYITVIPAGTDGVLFGTIEMMTDGLGVGLTSQVLADPDNMPEIDRALIDC